MASEGSISAAYAFAHSDVNAFTHSTRRTALPDYSPMDYLVSNLRHLIGSKSEKEVAEAAGVPQPWLNRVLNPDRPGGSKNPRDEHLRPLADLFRVTLSELRYEDLSSRFISGTPSQYAGLDAAKLAISIKAIEDAFAFYGEPFVASEEAELIALAYDYAQDSPANVVEMRAFVKGMVARGRNVGQREDGVVAEEAGREVRRKIAG